MKTTVLFDLDGTLTDSAPGILESIQYALEQMGIQPPPKAELLPFVGPPLLDTFQQHFHMSPETAEQAYHHYRRHYQEIGMYQNTVFDGIIPLLQALRQKGYLLGVATSKSEDFAKEILSHFDILSYFDCVAGSNFGERNTKAKVVAYALEQLHIQPQDALLVGDRMYDILGGKEVGITVVGVTYGYGTKEELETYHADAILSTPAELLSLLPQI